MVELAGKLASSNDVADNQKAIDLYDKATSLGNVNAMYELACIYEEGNTVAKNIDESI